MTPEHAALIEKLNIVWAQAGFTYCKAAASAIESLSARVEELERERLKVEGYYEDAIDQRDELRARLEAIYAQPTVCSHILSPLQSGTIEVDLIERPRRPE